MPPRNLAQQNALTAATKLSLSLSSSINAFLPYFVLTCPLVLPPGTPTLNNGLQSDILTLI